MFNLLRQDHFFPCLSTGRKSMQREGIFLTANKLPVKIVQETGDFFKKNILQTFVIVFISPLDWDLRVPRSCKVRTQQRKIREREAALSLDRLIKAQ